MQEVKTNYYKIISANIKLLRIDLGLSQEKFAESIGCSREYISRLENNKERISLSMLLDIALMYHKFPEDFFKSILD